jgi:predicted ATPase
MITKIYIDNFRCFTNFELELGPFHLLLGENGTGKSTLFDVLSRIRSLLGGSSVEECFFPSELTAWDTRTAQDFAVEMRVGDDQFRYELRIEHNLGELKQRIAEERFLWNSQVFYRFENGEAHLYHVAGSEIIEGTSFPFDWTRSFIPLLPERTDNQPLCRFRQAVYQWLSVRLVPPLMDTFSKQESNVIAPSGANFSSWYRYLTQAHPEVIEQVARSLRDVIPGMQHLRFARMGETMRLEASFPTANGR